MEKGFLALGLQGHFARPILSRRQGLTKGSLYKAFDDKHDLFIQALEMYLGKVRETLFTEWDKPGSAMEKLSRWADLATTACAKGGCLAIKTSDELAAEDADVRKILVEHWEALGGRLQEIVAEGQRAGHIRTDFSADNIVRILIRLAMGAAVAAPLASPARNVETFKAALDLIKA